MISRTRFRRLLMRILEIVFFGQETRSGLEFQSQWPGGLRMCKGPSKKEAGTPPFVLTICFDYDSVTAVFLVMEAFEL